MIRTKNRLGEVHKTKEGYYLRIVEYTSARKCTVEFENGIKIENKNYFEVCDGIISNPNHRRFVGVGFIGVGNYDMVQNGIAHKRFICWYGMMCRCYSKNDKYTQKAYLDCSVCDEWHNYQIFSKWFEENYIEGFQLDKDILVKGNKVYSPETCCFVPNKINRMFIKKINKNSDLPVGVQRRKNNSFIALCGSNGTNNRLGIFECKESAFMAYKKFKENEIKKLANEWKGLIAENVYNAIINYQVEITD